MKAQLGGPLRPGASGYVDGSTPHRPRQVLDWTTWREAHPDKARYMVNPAPVILRRVDDRKAYPAYEGSPKLAASPVEKVPDAEEDLSHRTRLKAREMKDDPPFLPGTVQTIRTAGTGSPITGVWTTPRSENQLMAQAVHAVQALQAQAHSVQLPIQGRGTSPWTPSNIKAACAPSPSEASKPQVEVEVRETEKPKLEGAATQPSLRPKVPPSSRTLTVPDVQENERPKAPSRSSSVGGTPEAAPRKIAIHRKEPGLALRPDSPKRKQLAAPITPVVRRESAPGGNYYGSKLDEPLSPGRPASTRRSRPETTSSDGGGRSSPTFRGPKLAAAGNQPRVASTSRITPTPREETNENASPGRSRRGLSLKCSFEEGSTGPKTPRASSSRARSTSRRCRSASRDPSRARTPTLQERTSTAMQALEHGMEPPGASDKWRVAELFSEAVPKSCAKVLRIERLVTPEMFDGFLKRTDGGENACNCGIAFYVPQAEELHHLSTGRMPRRRSAQVTVGSDAAVALKPLMENMQPDESPQAVSLVVVLCGPQVAQRLSESGTDRSSGPRCQLHVSDPDQLLLAYLVHIQLYGNSESDFEGRMGSPSPDGRQRSMSRQRKVSLTNPLIQETLLRLPSLREDSAGTVLLSSNSPEAEAVVSLYLQSGGAARLRRPPGVDLREALGGVVVQRFENKSLAQHYLAIEVDQAQGGPRYKEDVVWHGTRLKRSDGDATLAHKLQSIAEHGFDPSRCIKGAHAEGGIWVASCPMESFGVGGDGLVAFIICLAKTNFNEWVDTSCARVLQRERVLPLYSLVHV